MRILVTGGAGYIGSHFVDLANSHGYSEIVVVDDLSTGIAGRLPGSVTFYQVDLSGSTGCQKLATILKDHAIDAVVHFAAKKVVSESVVEPEYYFQENIGTTINILKAMRASETKKMIFSSSAAVYGEPDSRIVFEEEACHPINPYGESKMVSELALANASQAWGLEVISLRYFNVAGAKNSLLADTTTTNLMPAIRDAITNSRTLSIYGDDYDTADGTCVRDYVHVVDLVEAHHVALNSLASESKPQMRTYNVGTGVGSSVLEIIQGFEKLPDVEFDYRYEPRRPGDPAALMANVDKIDRELGWRARFSTDDIVRSVVDCPPMVQGE